MSDHRRRTAQAVVSVVFVALIVAPVHLSRFDARTSGGGEVVSHGFTLEEASRNAGIAFRHRPPALDPKLAHIAPYIAMFGASAAIVDADGDGRLDIYVTTSEPRGQNALYRNNGDGTFEDIAAQAGLSDMNRRESGASMGSVWADFDNDGDQDMLLCRWGELALMRNDGFPSFTDITVASGIRRRMNSNAAVWWDFDVDGDLDLYVAGYFPADIDLAHTSTTRVLANSFEFATNGGHNVLFENRGDGTFADATERLDLDCTRWTLALGSADLTGNGYPDLFLANDYGHDVLFVNEDGRRFRRVEPGGIGESPKSGMSVAFGDIGNDGAPAVFVSNISKRGYLSQGNNLWLDPAGRSHNVAVPAGVASTGWAWGAQFGDLNNDGWVDLFVTNGFISADPDQDYWYDMARLAGGSGVVFEDAANWPPIGDQSLSGFERSALFLNDRSGAFYDVAPRVGLTDTQDGRGVALGDLDDDGDLDIVVANQREDVLLYRNAVEADRSWIAFELVGTVGNRDAVGATITLHWNDMRRTIPITDGSGFSSQSSRRAHFGLGTDPVVHRATIRWLSGREQEIEHPEPNRLHRIVEPGGPA